MPNETSICRFTVSPSISRRGSPRLTSADRAARLYGPERHPGSTDHYYHGEGIHRSSCMSFVESRVNTMGWRRTLLASKFSGLSRRAQTRSHPLRGTSTVLGVRSASLTQLVCRAHRRKLKLIDVVPNEFFVNRVPKQEILPFGFGVFANSSAQGMIDAIPPFVGGKLVARLVI